MASTQDYFSDMLAPGEQVIAGLGAAGPVVERAVGQEHVWFQLGVRNDALAASLRAAGITVVQDRCTLADHQRLGVARHSRGG